jgi:hypothetical protein
MTTKIEGLLVLLSIQTLGFPMSFLVCVPIIFHVPYVLFLVYMSHFHILDPNVELSQPIALFKDYPKDLT